MIALVTGGARSGKSAFAEELAMSLGSPRWYLATMRDTGAESRRRIARHVSQRAGKGFTALEVVDGMPSFLGGVALLEDLPNLLAARLYAEDFSLRNPVATCNGIVRDLRAVAGSCESLVVVTNEIGADGVSYAPETRAFVECLGRLGCRIGSAADRVVEVVAGCPIEVKRP